jgi:hypothetical protein
LVEASNSEELYNDVIYEYNQVQMESFTTELDEETALEIAVAESMEGSMGCEDAGANALSNSVAEARATLPVLCTLHAIEPGGWCFYDCVLAHLGKQLPGEVHRYTLVTAIVECMARRRGVIEPQLTEDDDDAGRRREEVLDSNSEEFYLRVLDQLDVFDYYVLSKLEMCIARFPVLDSWLYADYPEINAFQIACGITLLRVKPPATWTSSCVGSVVYQ